MQWMEAACILGKNYCKGGGYLLRVCRAAIQACKDYTIVFCNKSISIVSGIRAQSRGDKTWKVLASIASRVKQARVHGTCTSLLVSLAAFM